MKAAGWQEVIGVIGIFTLLIGVILMGIWQFGATWRAKAVLAREDQYRAGSAGAASADPL